MYYNKLRNSPPLPPHSPRAFQLAVRQHNHQTLLDISRSSSYRRSSSPPMGVLNISIHKVYSITALWRKLVHNDIQIQYQNNPLSSIHVISFRHHSFPMRTQKGASVLPFIIHFSHFAFSLPLRARAILVALVHSNAILNQ